MAKFEFQIPAGIYECQHCYCKELHLPTWDKLNWTCQGCKETKPSVKHICPTEQYGKAKEKADKEKTSILSAGMDFYCGIKSQHGYTDFIAEDSFNLVWGASLSKGDSPYTCELKYLTCPECIQVLYDAGKIAFPSLTPDWRDDFGIAEDYYAI